MNAGYQAEYVRFKNAGWALIKVPGEASDYTDADLNSFLTCLLYTSDAADEL